VTIEKLLEFRIMLYRLFCCVANHTLYGNIFCQLDEASLSSTCATQTNMEESEHDTELIPKRGTTLVAWTWFGYEKSENRSLQNMPQAGPDNRLKHH
jgi:hypothetical protein